MQVRAFERYISLRLSKSILARTLNPQGKKFTNINDN